MPNESGQLPKINLETSSSAVPIEDSVLIPKIDIIKSEDRAPILNDPPKKNSGKRNIWLIAGGAVAVFILYNLISGLLFYQKGKNLLVNVGRLSDSAKSQDLGKIKSEISNTKNSLNRLNSIYKLIAWEKFIPFIGPYIGDVGHGIRAGLSGLDAGETVLTVAVPYADLLGLKENSGNVLAAKTGAQTTQERIDFVIKTIPDLLPKIDLISSKVKVVQDELSQIDPDRYPDKFQGKPLKPQIKNVQGLVSEAATFIVNSKPFLESAPYLLGMDSPRTYLILFQNDKELRPTGGFMTAYAIMKVDKAKFNPVSSSDIYSMDAQYKPSIPAPAPIIKYIKGPYVLSQNLRLRDMNWSPDFATSMQTFLPAAKQVGI
ncbi:MAG: DUF4012 domain-containing protein, partial [Candidatus Woesebacteria bacterium]|nr:DUF4012 domain-containing protein [Candidatus Woesebacteria bacterium]